MTAELLAYSENREVLEELISGGHALATELGMSVAAAVLGGEDATDAEPLFRCGARRVYAVSSPHLRDLDNERIADALEQVVSRASASIVLIGSTRRGKELAGRLAQRLQAGCITDAIGLAVQDGELVARRHALGGNTVSTEVLMSPTKVFSVKARTFEAVPQVDEPAGEIVPVDLDLDPPRVNVIDRQAKSAEQVDLEKADVVVAVGRGLEKQDDLPIPQSLADTLAGELGCTRSLCSDCGWLSEERMIGISGKSCRPRLLISVGVSGQIQHAVGIMDSKIIVAINKDESAPIFQIADYGIVGDLYEVLPKLVEQLKKRTSAGPGDFQSG